MVPELKQIRNFGVGFLGYQFGARDVLRFAAMAEDAGFGICWVAEDYFFRGAFSLAAACAARTRSIRIGIGAVNPYTRHPALTAMEMAGLCEIAGENRAVLALGASNKPWIEKMGLAYAHPRRSLQETAEIIRGMFRGDSVTLAGRCFQVSDVKFSFSPRVSKLPIYFGVVGPRNLELAGEVADGVLLSVMTSPAYVRFARGQIERGAAKIGRKLEQFDLQAYLLISVGKDRTQARNAIKPVIGSFIGMAGFFGPDPILTCTGMSLDEIKPLTELALQGKDVAPLVTDWMLDTFTISGTPEECQERLRLLYQAGVRSPIAFETPGVDFEEMLGNVIKYLSSNSE